MELIDFMLEHDLLSFQNEANSWQGAVKKSCEKLESLDFITNNYCEDIFNQTEKNGFYYLVAPGIAIPHARPEAGVNKNCVSLTTFKNGIYFNDESYDPVWIFLTIAAIDNTSHNEVLLAQAADLLSNNKFLELLKNVTNISEFKEIIKEL